ncbi:IclR family transcriptional regulator [Georgenia sp. SYP-B2076]|uniref:IclR family transcriptional regulator n=1 Tax=Georgenia sp. SYP-B2076 TaxID=2495881 RepID=UPI000F8E6EF4|nr:IclR family transcriptional regulator [Georgenia sp. SYP-B2076]
MRNADVSSPLGSVDKALQLLLLLRGGEPMSVKDTAQRLDVAPSTAHRLLTALTHRGFAAQGSDRRYRPGPALGETSTEPLTLGRLREAAHEPMAALHAQVSETVQLMILRGGNIQFVDGLEGRANLRVGVRIGDQMPAFCSSGGKAMLAELSPVDLEQVYRGGLPPWPSSPITSLAQLKRHLTATRRAGFGTNFEETERGVVGLGVCLHSDTGQPVGAVTIAMPRARFQEADMHGYVTALRECAQAIQDRLRGRRAPTTD